MIRIGERAPPFTASDADGRMVSLDDFRGSKNVVLYFYPKDFTLVCTKEACIFRDAFEELAASDTVVLGLSLDSAETHQRFAHENALNFRLLTDRDGAISAAYGALGLLGRVLSVTKRVTFLIDKGGIVRGVFRHELMASRHLQDVRQALERLQGFT